MPPASLLPICSLDLSCEQLIPSSEGSGSQLGWILPPRGTCGNMSETFLVDPTRGGKVPLSPHGWRPGMPLTSYNAQDGTRGKELSGPNVESIDIEKI